MKFKSVLIGVLILLLITGIIGFYGYSKIFLPNTPKQLSNEYVEIKSNTSFEQLTNQLVVNKQVIDIESFKLVSKLMKFDKPIVRNGRFKIKPNWSNRALISHLRIGEQAPVNVIFHTDRTVESLAGTISSVLEIDSVSLSNFLTSPDSLASIGYDKETIISLFVPNTYQQYWNTSIRDFLKRMQKENKSFWNKNNRKAKAKKLKMTSEQVYTLASIVEKETNQNIEKKTVAGVYVNRLKRGMLLQADPTVVFANNDFTITRVLKKHLEFDSPYNTYKYAGLPPGPISLASISSIDAVLDHEDHKYLYFCAKPDWSGQHAFAKTLSQHNANARKYHRWLNKITKTKG